MKNDETIEIDINSDLYKLLEEENFELIKSLLITDVKVEGKMICLKFASRKVYSEIDGNPKIFLGSKSKKFMPCVFSTEENIGKIRNILIDQYQYYLEYIDKSNIYDIYIKNSLNFKIPLYILSVLIFILTANPSLSIITALSASVFTIAYSRSDYKKINIKSEDAPIWKLNRILDEQKEKKVHDKEEFIKFKEILPKVKVKNKVLQKVRKHTHIR